VYGAGMAKLPFTLRISLESQRLLDGLLKFYETKTAVIEAGIRALATKHKIK
jgi:hypothetical protein